MAPHHEDDHLPNNMVVFDPKDWEFHRQMRECWEGSDAEMVTLLGKTIAPATIWQGQPIGDDKYLVQNERGEVYRVHESHLFLKG